MAPTQLHTKTVTVTLPTDIRNIKKLLLFPERHRTQALACLQPFDITDKRWFSCFAGEGLVELRSREVTGVSDDGNATVTVLRKLGHDFTTEVSWSTRDGDAVEGDHYLSEGGNHHEVCTKSIQRLCST